MTRLKTVATLKPGDVIYMRPDHASYDPGYFGVVFKKPDTPDHIGALQTFAEGSYASTAFVDFERAVEIVGMDIMARCTGLARNDIRAACNVAREVAFDAKAPDEGRLEAHGDYSAMMRGELGIVEPIEDAPTWAEASNDGHG